MSNTSLDAESLNSIYTKIQELDQKIKEIENNRNLIVTSANNKYQLNPLQITPEELIDIYNYAPILLKEYAIPVSVNRNIYNNYVSRKTYLQADITGYYWVIVIEEDHGKNYFLVPNGNKRLNLHRLQSQVNLLFTFKGEKPSLNSSFTLEKLGQMEILPSGNEWEFRQKGSIQIGKSSSGIKLLNELENITNENGEIPKSLEELLKLVEKANSISALKVEANKTLENQFGSLILRMKEIEKENYLEVKNLKRKIDQQQEQIMYTGIGGAVVAFFLLLIAVS